MHDKTKQNPVYFKPQGSLGNLFDRAKSHNRLNEQLIAELPSELNGLSLCLVKDQQVFLIAKNSSIAFRAKKQKKKLLSIIKKIDGLDQIKLISVSIDEKNTS
jgi:hypothetical protein